MGFQLQRIQRRSRLAGFGRLEPLDRASQHLGKERREMSASAELLVRTEQGAEHRDALAMPSPKLLFIELQSAWPHA